MGTAAESCVEIVWADAFSIFFIQRIPKTPACAASSRSLVHGKKWRAELETLLDLLSGRLLQVSAKIYVRIFCVTFFAIQVGGHVFSIWYSPVVRKGDGLPSIFF